MPKIKFEGIASETDEAEVKDGYADLKWDNVWAIDEVRFPESEGLDNALRSGSAVAYNELGKTASFWSTEEDFDLLDGSFTALWNTGLKVKVFAYDDGEKVGVERFDLDQERSLIRFGEKFESIDKVRIISKGGSDVDPNDGGEGTHFALDDLHFHWL
jgi:hypothetical protein